jgi:hypothetical protein
MTFYSLVLFVHVTAVLGLSAALSIEALSLFHLRRASTLTDASRWIEPVPRLPFVTGGSALVIFFSGVYLAIRMSAFDAGWPKVTVGALLLIAPLGALTGRRTRDSPGLRRCERDQLRTPQPLAGSVLEDLA